MASGVRAVSVSFLEHGVALLRMQKGENRINKEFVETFHGCLDEVECNKECRGLITTADGKFFSNGLDLEKFFPKGIDPAKVDLPEMERFDNFLNTYNDLLARILTFPMPTAAAINGHCFAGGAILAMSHDKRVMNSERGWVSLNEVFLGVRLAPFTIKYMQEKLSPSTFQDLLVYGRRFTGSEAVEAGLVNTSVPGDLVGAEAQRLLTASTGKNAFPRESFHHMKTDLFSQSLKYVHTKRPQ